MAMLQRLRRLARRRGAAAATAAVMIASVLAVAPTIDAADLPSTVQNLQHTANTIRGPRAGYGLMVFLASESDENRDLNGDGVIGDTNTSSYQVWDSTTGQIHSLLGNSTEWSNGAGIFAPAVRFDEGVVAYTLAEGATGRDLNGDGDTSDDIMHVWTRAGGVTNLGFDVFSGASFNYEIGGGKVVFSATENQLHPEVIAGSQDLNGDGDANDVAVVLAWDQATGAITVLGEKRTVSATIVEDDGLFAWVSGAGSTTNEVVIYDASDGSFHGCCFAPFDDFSAAGQALDIRDGYVGFGASVGGGDITFRWWDLLPGGLNPETNSGVAIDFSHGMAALEGGWMAFAADETAPGIDLNGDGDQLDSVLHLWDPVAGSSINSGLATDTTYDIVAGETAVAFVVDEDEQGADVNGDGDISSDDRIVHVWPITDALPTNTQLGLTGFDLAVDGDIFGIGATQAADGSILDGRVHVWSPSGGLVDLGVSSTSDNGTARSSIRAADGQIAFFADELATGADLDGDGVQSNGIVDSVPTVWDPVNGLWHAPDPGKVLPDSGGIGNALAFTRSHAMFIVREQPNSGPGVDLNCDGDTVDDIVHVATLAATPAPTPCTYPVLTPGRAGVIEGDAGTVTLEVPITLSAASSNEVTVDWTTLDNPQTGMAVGDVDYVADSGTVTFAPGETEQSVEVTVNGDLVDEPDLVFGEWVLVAFSNPSAGATLDLSFFGLGIGVIIDDDPPPVITPGTGFVAEGHAGTVALDVEVTLSNPSAEEVTVDWTTLDTGDPGIAESDVDYEADSGTVTFAPGETTQSVEVTVDGDLVDEPDLVFGEWVLVAFSNPSSNVTLDVGFFGLGIGIIVDDD